VTVIIGAVLSRDKRLVHGHDTRIRTHRYLRNPFCRIWYPFLWNLWCLCRSIKII
jgi:hypothetical protein